MVALFVNTGGREKQLLPIRILQELKKHWCLFGTFLTYPGNKYNTNYLDLYREYCPQLLQQPRNLSP